MRISLLLICLLVVSACASPVDTSRQLHNQQSNENAAWIKAQWQAETDCGYSHGGVVSRGEALEQRRCINRAIDQHLGPIALYPENLEEFKTQGLKIASRYDAGELDHVQYKALLKVISDQYDSVWINKANAQIEQAVQNRQALSIYSNALAGGAQAYNQGRQEQWERQRASMPRNVQCTESAGTYYCQEY